MYNLSNKIVTKCLLAFVLFVVSLTAIAANAVNDPSFEGGFPNSEWTPISTFTGIEGFPICNADNCSGVDFARTGAWYIWIGGLGAGVTSSVEQTLTIPAESQELSLWALRGICDDPSDTVFIKIDNTVVGSLVCTATDAEMQQYTFSVTGFNDDNSHTLYIGGTVGGTNGSHSNFFIDDLEIFFDDTIFINGFE
jgi:hypothetical protein